MKIAVTTELSQQFAEFEVDSSCTVGALRALIAAEWNVPVETQMLHFNGAEIVGDDRTLTDAGLANHDLVMLKRRRSAAAHQSAQGQQRMPESAEEFRQTLLATPELMERVRASNPRLIEAALSNPAAFAQMFARLQEHRREQEEQARLLQQAAENPFDIEVQRRIEEQIRAERINENMQSALEHAPETFGRVFMLYIACTVNNVPCKMFVDSGAQMTIMSKSFAERCHLDGLIDRRWQGVARGVGSARIVGRIHMALINIEGAVLPCSFSVLEDQPMDVLFGLDMLRRHQCIIDLSKNVLRVGDVETRFLDEAELPESARTEEVPSEASVPSDARPTSAPPAQTNVPAATPSTLAPPTPNPALSASAGAGQQAPQLASLLQAAAQIQVPGTAPASTAPAQVAARAAANVYPEELVASLMALGASRQSVIQALDAAGGNPDIAAGFLF